MMRIFLLFPLIAGLASVCHKEYICPEEADRDLRLMLLQNGRSKGRLVDALYTLVNGVDRIDKWLTQSDHSLRVGHIRLYNTDNQNCIDYMTVDNSFREVRDEVRKSRFQSLTGLANRELAVLVWLANTHWLSEGIPTERRIFVALTSKRPLIGDTPLVVQQDLKQMCPMGNTPTVSQIREAARKQSIGIYVFLWHSWIEDYPAEVKKWNELMAEADITDYRIFGTGWKTHEGQAPAIFTEAMCTMAAPSYIATTTTFKP